MRALRRWQRIWLDHAVAPEVVRLFRLLFFGVLAVDLWLEVEHAPRYGAGDFNVSHLPWLDGLLPVLERPVIAAGNLLQAYLAALIALGAGRRAAVWALTALYGVTYFGSQLDSYQHHYLVFLVLLACCGLTWPRGSAAGDAGAREPVPGWPIRLILAQVSIVYLFAALAKLDPRWWSGAVLELQVHGWAEGAIEQLGGFATAARLVVATELFLAAAIHVPALRAPAAALGIAFHVGIEAAGFRIGLFSYFMVAIYTLVLPERPIAAAARWLGERAGRLPLPRLPGSPPGTLATCAAAIAGGALLLATAPIGGPALAAAALAAAAGGALALSHRAAAPRTALLHLAACAALALLARPSVTDTARDYYRFWGGSSRRLGDLDTATAAYQRVVEVAPDYAQGHTSLANLYRRTGQPERALAEANVAQRLAPDDHRPHLVEAMVHDQAGDGPAALAAAERALERAPGDTEARRIAERWRASKAPAEAPAGGAP